MIQDIHPHKLINHFDPSKKAGEDSLVIVIRENEVMVKGDLYPRKSELDIEADKLTFLFSLEGERLKERILTNSYPSGAM